MRMIITHNDDHDDAGDDVPLGVIRLGVRGRSRALHGILLHDGLGPGGVLFSILCEETKQIMRKTILKKAFIK